MGKQEDANLILKLYDLRREPVMREARNWFFTFNPTTPADYMEAMMGEHSGHLRMVITYWDMAASFVTSGVLHQQLFLESGGELLYVYEKSKSLIGPWREYLGNPKIMVFFGSIFLSLLPQNLPAWMDAAVLAIVAVNEFACSVIVAVALR